MIEVFGYTLDHKLSMIVDPTLSWCVRVHRAHFLAKFIQILLAYAPRQVTKSIWFQNYVCFLETSFSNTHQWAIGLRMK